MGVCTKGRLNGYVKPEYILNYIKQKYDLNALMKISVHDFGKKSDMDFIVKTFDDSERWITEEGRISFMDGNDPRELVYYHDNILERDEFEYFKSTGIEELTKQETTGVSLGAWGRSVDIMKDIVSQFGGWIDENDSDDQSFYPILRSEDENITPVFHVTMQEVYEKFGGVVIIDK